MIKKLLEWIPRRRIHAATFPDAPVVPVAHLQLPHLTLTASHPPGAYYFRELTSAQNAQLLVLVPEMILRLRLQADGADQGDLLKHLAGQIEKVLA